LRVDDNNAFWVREDVLGDLPGARVGEGYAVSRFRESRDESHAPSYVRDQRARLAIIRNMPLWDVEAERSVTISEKFGALGDRYDPRAMRTILASLLQRDRSYEPELQASVSAVVRGGWTCADVGAHHGVFTRLLADLVGESGHVVAFEAILGMLVGCVGHSRPAVVQGSPS